MLNHKSGFLESSSTTSSTKEKKEEMYNLQKKNQGLQEKKEVKYTSCLIHSRKNDNVSFASFEKNTKGIGMKLLTKMGYNSKVGGIHGHGIINPIKVGTQPRHEGFRYVQE